MKRKTLAICGILLLLLVSMFGSVYAQDGTDPEIPPEETEEVDPEVEPAGSKFFTHPVVQLLSLYFDREVEEETEPTDPTDPTEPGEGEEPTDGEEPESESGLGPIGEQIAAYHEQGMGFGTLVKIFAMAEASAAACPDTEPVDPGDGTTPVEPECTAVTADELVTAFKSGGMGALFKQYGKPALLGVGHVKKALKHLDTQEPVDPEEPVVQGSQGKYKPQKPPKVKTNNGKGPNK